MEGEDLVKGFNELEEEKNNPKPENTKTQKYLIVILSIILIIFFILLILLIIRINILEKRNEKESEKSDDKHEKQDVPIPKINESQLITFIRSAFCGNISSNLTYGEEGIENTFKSGGKNYREEIGPINENQDYKFNPLFNKYDLYIPYSAIKTKKSKGIIVFIHGGAWVQGTKEEMSYLCQIYFEHEYIIANLDYTLLNITDFTIYRQLDDISACVKDITKRLKSMGFNENELEIAVGGGSAGGHLSLLYGYLVKEPPLPVKFIIDTIGPVNLETDDFYAIYEDEETLPDIEPETVNKALKEKTYKKPMVTDNFILLFLNCFIGKKYSQEELNGMLKDEKIDKKNEKYIELFEKAKYGFPINWMKDKNIPILALYGGKDLLVGFAQYARLKETAVKYGNTLQLVYSRYGGHSLSEFEHTEGIEAAKDFHFYMLKFCEDYFTKY